MAVTYEQFTNTITGSVFRAALRDGIAKAIGMLVRYIRITRVGKKYIRRLATADTISARKLSGLGLTDVEFEVESNSADPAQLVDLESNLKAAGQDGSLVANVQKSMSDSGVLTTELKNMDRIIAASDFQASTTTQMIPQTQVRASKAPTPAPGSAGDGDLTMIIAVVVGGVALLGVVVALVVLKKRGMKETITSAAPSVNNGKQSDERHLSISVADGSSYENPMARSTGEKGQGI